MKTCRSCRTKKPDKEFGIRKKGKSQIVCKACTQKRYTFDKAAENTYRYQEPWAAKIIREGL